MKTTIKDVAKYANVSTTTVSQVLNNRKIRVSEEKREKILEAVKVLNYIPNPYASNLKNKRNKTIGLIVPDLNNFYFSEIAKGVVNQAQKLDIDVLIADANNESLNEIYYLEKFKNKLIDGMVIVISDEKSDMGEKSINKIIDRNKIPIILFDREFEGVNCNIIKADHEKGGYFATKYLLELGHTRIGCITGGHNIKNSLQRFEGYKKALLENGITFSKELVFEGNYQMESGKEGAKYLVKREVSAIFVCNDMMAYGVYEYLKKINIKIPREISIIGFDDVLFSKFLEVSLTTVRQPITKMCEMAIKVLNKNLGVKELKPKTEIFVPELIIRDSTERFEE